MLQNHMRGNNFLLHFSILAIILLLHTMQRHIRDFRSFFLYLSLVACLAFGQKKNPNQFGSISIPVKGGAADSPSYTMLSPSLQGRIVFRGQTKFTSGNTLHFHLVPDLLDPSNTDKAPFKDNQFIVSRKARLLAHLSSDANKSLDRIEVLDGGFGYSYPPVISIGLPGGSARGIDFEPASAVASINASGIISSVSLTNPGMGFDFPPDVTVQGGVHYLRLIEEDSARNGKFYKISANTDRSISLSNTFSEDLSLVFPANSMIEVFQAWTLGDLFGYDSVKLQSGNSLTADIIYILKEPSMQHGDNAYDYVGYFHDGTGWRQVNGDGSLADNVFITPGRALVLARRNPNDLDLVLSGNPLVESTLLEIPSAGKKLFVSNPFGVDVMLSDLIDPSYISDNPNNTFSWLAHENQEQADNIRILHNNVWSTYWHDGTNQGITRRAWATAKAGSGVGASITQVDISMSSGLINNLTNDNNEIIVTSPNHGLADGFVVHVYGAKGRKTNQSKMQVDADNLEVLDGQGVVIDSAANGYHKIVVVDDDRFRLTDRLGNSDFINDGNAKWSTGNSGIGYEGDTLVAFVGGGGEGATGVAKVQGGKVISITITQAGAGYVEAPEILFSLGGWRKLGGGGTPEKDVIIPSGSGILLERNNPLGVAVRIPLLSPFDYLRE